jgi:outer membrane protein assembly factor BamA
MRLHRSLRTCLAMVFTGVLSSQVIPVCSQTRHVQRQQLVETVEIQGNRRLTDGDILAHLKTRPGEPFSQRQMQRDLQRMIESGVFNKTQTRVITEPGARGGIVVIFEVFELPLILEITFTGLDIAGIEESEIVNALRENRINLVKGEVRDPDNVRAALHLIQDLLASRGRENVRVAAHEKIDNPTDVSIEISFAYAGR